MDPIDSTAIPADVRAAGPQAVKLYDAALQFEGMLTQQLTQQMFDAQNAMGDDSDSDSGDGSSVPTDGGPYQAMLPQALSDSLTSSGGLGLADELYRAMALRYGIGAPAQPQPDQPQNGEGA